MNYSLAFDDDVYLTPRKVIKRKRKRKMQNDEKTYKLSAPNKESEQYYIGDICIGITNNTLLDNYNECTATFKFTEDVTNLLFNFNKTLVTVKVAMDINFLKDLFSCKIMFFKFLCLTDKFFICLYFQKLPFNYSLKLSKIIKPVFNLVFDVAAELLENDKKQKLSGPEEILNLYKNLKERHINVSSNNELEIDHPFLIPTLHPYQMDGVRWMLMRETKNTSNEEILNPLFELVTLSSGMLVYYDKYSGIIELDKPLIKPLRTGGILADEMGLGKTLEVLTCILMNPVTEFLYEDSKLPEIVLPSRKRQRPPTIDSVDYVSDEKCIKVVPNRPSNYLLLSNWYEATLESTKIKKVVKRTIACICGNEANENTVTCKNCNKVQHSNCLGYDNSYGEYFCPQCWINKENEPCKGTLIVCPISLKQQWIDEILKHIRGKFKVLNYKGCSYSPIYPIELKNYDVVITTYNVLQSELRLTENEQVRNLRNPSKYGHIGCPITNMKWWRLCLDEAQCIENKLMVAEMAQRIDAEHRWAVTGTPISKNMSDLFTLISYLKIEPYSEQFCWEQLLHKPYLLANPEPMYNFLSNIMWRTSKCDVINQINIPSQKIIEHWVEFTEVERYFYDREHEIRYSDFLGKLKNYDQNIPLKSLDKRQFKEILTPFSSLRQACSHHLAVKGKYLTTRKPVSSMSNLLEALIEKKVLELEEFLRILISTLNGLAGIQLLLQNPQLAIEAYKKALEQIEKYNGVNNQVHLQVDLLQIIHILHNLTEILDGFPQCAKTDEAVKYKTLCEEQQRKYLDKHNKLTLKVYSELLCAEDAIMDIRNKFISKKIDWYGDAVDYIRSNDLWREYCNKLQTITCNDAHQNVDQFTSESRDTLYFITIWNDELYDLRENVLSKFDVLYEIVDDCITIPKKIVNTAMNCHLRPSKKKEKNKKFCPLCMVNEKLKLYESKLFFMRNKEENVTNSGSWKCSLEEYALRSIYNTVKHKEGMTDVIKDGLNHMKLLDELKTEFKSFSKFWQNVNSEIAAYDELDMCKMRYSLKEEDKEKSYTSKKVQNILKQLDLDIKQKNVHELAENELEYQKTVLRNQEMIQMDNLEKNLGVYSYLTTLKTQQFAGQKPDPCPVCRCVLETQWNMLKCGHCYCLDCMQVLIGRGRESYILCSICRQKQEKCDISYIKTDAKITANEIEIKGNVSTKMEAVVRLIMQLKKKEENVKILIFSNWISLLKILQEVLNVNDISSELIKHVAMDKQLNNFKDKSKGITTLLLPIHLGGKGLNLTEASQVIFLDSVIDPAEELQAIGRIHRIGQKRQTCVHKFLMKDSIEEKIHNAITSDATKWNQNKITLQQIVTLFKQST